MQGFGRKIKRKKKRLVIQNFEHFPSKLLYPKEFLRAVVVAQLAERSLVRNPAVFICQFLSRKSNEKEAGNGQLKTKKSEFLSKRY